MNPFSRLAIVVAGATALIVGGALAEAAQTREARGTVAAVSDGSLTVKAGDQTLVFMVDKGTLIEAKGAGSRTRQAKAENPGAAPVKITDYVKSGGAVLVSYREAAGANHALSVRPISDEGGNGGAIAAEAAKTASGKVKSITASSLILDLNGRDMTFAVDNETGVRLRGASKITKPAGGRVAVTDLVRNGDIVSIEYLDKAGAPTASQIRIRQAGTVTR